MIDTLTTILWVTFVLVFSGWRGLQLIGIEPRDDRLAFFGWALGLGALLNGLVLFALGALWPGSFHLIPVTAAQASLILGLGILGRWRRHPAPWRPPAKSTTPVGERLFFVVVGLALAVGLLRILIGNLDPALGGDEGMLWGFKARAIADAGGLGPEYLASLTRPALRHEDYPLLNPLLQAWVMTLESGSAILLRLPLQLGALGLLCVFAAALRRVGGPLVAAALLVSFLASPLTRDAFQTAGAEGLVALGLVMAADAFGRYERDSRGAWVGLGAVGLALALFTKNDAQLFALALVAGAAARALTWPPARAPLRAALWLLLPVAVVLFGAIFNAHAGFQNDLTAGKGDGLGLFARLGAQALDYLPPTAAFFADQVFTTPRFDGATFLFLGLALLFAGPRALAGEAADRARLGRALCASVTVLSSLSGLFLIYLATPQPLEWHLDSSALRVIWQLLPLAGLALATLLGSSERSPTSR